MTAVSLVSYQPLFQAAVFKYIFISTKVEFIVFTFTLYSKKQAETKVINKRLILTFLLFIYLFIYLFNIYLLTISTMLTLLTMARFILETDHPSRTSLGKER